MPRSPTTLARRSLRSPVTLPGPLAAAVAPAAGALAAAVSREDRLHFALPNPDPALNYSALSQFRLIFFISWPRGRIPAPSPGGTGRTRRSPALESGWECFPGFPDRAAGWMESSKSAFLAPCVTSDEPSGPGLGVSVGAARQKRLYPAGGSPSAAPQKKETIQQNKPNPVVVSPGPYLSAISK